MQTDLHDFDSFNLLPGCTRVDNCASNDMVRKFGSRESLGCSFIDSAIQQLKISRIRIQELSVTASQERGPSEPRMQAFRLRTKPTAGF